MKLIVGLGNPGPQYRHTRHNIGFMALDRVAERLGADFDSEKFRGLLARAQHGSHQVILLKPQTFMNLSGISVAAAMRNRPMKPEDLLVVLDDVNLPLGSLRLREGGSAGGHNGLKSINEHLGNQQYPRLRIGVGDNRMGRSLSDHVLGTFHADEKEAVRETIEKAADGVLTYIERGIHPAMNLCNARPRAAKDDPAENGRNDQAE